MGEFSGNVGPVVGMEEGIGWSDDGVAFIFEFRGTVRSKLVGVHLECEEDRVGVVVGLVPVGRRVSSERLSETGEGCSGRGGDWTRRWRAF